MENMDKKQCGDMCGGSCGGGNCCGMQMHGCHGGRHHLSRIILKLVIVIIIFCFGFKLGEITGFIRAEYGSGVIGESGWGMMRGNYLKTFLPSANNTTPTPVK